MAGPRLHVSRCGLASNPSECPRPRPARPALWSVREGEETSPEPPPERPAPTRAAPARCCHLAADGGTPEKSPPTPGRPGNRRKAGPSVRRVEEAESISAPVQPQTKPEAAGKRVRTPRRGSGGGCGNGKRCPPGPRAAPCSGGRLEVADAEVWESVQQDKLSSSCRGTVQRRMKAGKSARRRPRWSPETPWSPGAPVIGGERQQD